MCRLPCRRRFKIAILNRLMHSSPFRLITGFLRAERTVQARSRPTLRDRNMELDMGHGAGQGGFMGMGRWNGRRHDHHAYLVSRGIDGDVQSESRMVCAFPTSNPSSRPLTPSTLRHISSRFPADRVKPVSYVPTHAAPAKRGQTSTYDW